MSSSTGRPVNGANPPGRNFVPIAQPTPLSRRSKRRVSDAVDRRPAALEHEVDARVREHLRIGRARGRGGPS